jgi:uncharacterized FAD-dependent dehydrogenase
LRSFCTNNNAAYVAVEETYGDITYNGHAKKGEEYRNNMTNFGIIMEIKGIDNPFEWSRNLVQKCQENSKGLYYSPSRVPGLTSEGEMVSAEQIYDLQPIREAFEGHFEYVENFIKDMNKVFNFDDDWGIYIPEVKYLNEEVLVNYKNLSLKNYSNVYFTGDTLSARGITVSGAQGIYVAEHLINMKNIDEEIWYDGDLTLFI